MTKQTRKTAILTAVVLGAALLGLFATGSLQNSDRVSAAGALGQVLPQSSSGTSNADTGAPIWAIVKMLSALAVVVVALYGGLYLLKRMMTNRRFAASQDATLEVMESAYVGPKKMVSLVRVGKKAILIGVTDQQISMLTELDPDETTAILAQTSRPKVAESFGQLFKKTTDKFRETRAKKEHVIVEV